MFVIRGRLVSVGTVQASDHEISIRVKKKSDTTSAVLTHVFAVRYHHAMHLHMKTGKRTVKVVLMKFHLTAMECGSVTCHIIIIIIILL